MFRDWLAKNDPEPQGDDVKTIRAEFDKYLGVPLGSMDRVGYGLYRPDLDIFEAGYKAALSHLSAPIDVQSKAEDVATTTNKDCCEICETCSERGKLCNRCANHAKYEEKDPKAKE
jgi:hypothetical protein